MRHRLLALFILAAAIAVFIVLKSPRPEAPKVEAHERTWRVATMPADLVTASPTLTLYGRIEAHDRLSVEAPVSGSMLLATDESGEKRLAGINQGKDSMAGTVVSFTVYVRKFNPALAPVLGEEPFTSRNTPVDRRQ